MNSKIIEQPKEVKPEYPCLKLSNIGRVFLFTSPNTGVVIHDQGNPANIGRHETCLDASNYSPFTGTVQLSN